MHLLFQNKCSIFHNIFKYMVFKGIKRRYYGVKAGLTVYQKFMKCKQPKKYMFALIRSKMSIKIINCLLNMSAAYIQVSKEINTVIQDQTAPKPRSDCSTWER